MMKTLLLLRNSEKNWHLEKSVWWTQNHQQVRNTNSKFITILNSDSILLEKYSKKKSAKKRKPDDSFSDDSFDGLSDSSSSYSKKHKKGLEEVVKKDVVPATVSAVIPAERRPSMNNTFIEIPPLPVVPLLEPIPVSRFTPSPYFSFALAPMYPEEGAQPHKPIVTPVVPQAELDPLFPYGDDFLFYDWLPVSAHN